MYANKKLFLVTLQYQGYVLADDDYDAENFTGNITNSERPTIKVEEVRSNVLRWPGYACIYHAEQYYRDINIDECFPPQTAELEVTEPKALGGHGASALSDLIEQLENAHVLIDRARAALAELEPDPVAWMYQGEPSFDGTDWRETWDVTTDKRLAEFKAAPDQPIPLFSIQPQRQ